MFYCKFVFLRWLGSYYATTPLNFQKTKPTNNQANFSVLSKHSFFIKQNMKPHFVLGKNLFLFLWALNWLTLCVIICILMFLFLSQHLKGKYIFAASHENRRLKYFLWSKSITLFIRPSVHKAKKRIKFLSYISSRRQLVYEKIYFFSAAIFIWDDFSDKSSLTV